MIRLRTLGQLALGQGEQAKEAPVALQPKRLALLVYLAAAHPSGTCSRDTLVALFWPDLDDAHARTALRQGLHGLRRSLGAAAITGSGDGQVGVDPTMVECDAVAFATALEASPAAALAMYGGPFLDGFHVSDAPEFERWVERERRRLEVEAIAAAWRLAEGAGRSGDWRASGTWAERALQLAPYDEPGLRRYLEILEKQADAATAVQAFSAFRERLREEMGLEPSPETAALVERIRSQRAQPLTTEPSGRAALAVPLPHIQGARAPALRPRIESPVATPGASDNAEVVGRTSWWARRAVGVAALVTLGAILTVANAIRGPTSHQPTAVAVLPFRSLGSDTSQAYLADALRYEIVDQLSRLSSLRVVSPASLSAYHTSTAGLRRLGADLEVARVVEGGAEVEGGHLRVFVQLLDPSTGQEVWAEHYDRKLDDAFAVQSEIAERIASAVGVTVTRADDGAIRTPPTQDATAYRLYLQALDYERRPALRREDDDAAQQLLERAIALDSTFGPARAALAMVHWREYDLGYDQTPERLALARKEAEKARSLAPDLPETHLATGLVEHFSRDDFQGALDEFRIAVHGAPNHADAWMMIGAVDRSLGAWDSAFVALDRARKLDPRNAVLPFIMGETHHHLHQYREAIDYYRQAFALAPDMIQPRISMGWSYVLWQGQVDTLKAVLTDLSRDTDPGAGGGPVLGDWIGVWMWEGKADSVLDALRARRPEPGVDPRSSAMVVAEAETLLGDTAAAREAYRQAEAYADSLLALTPDDVGLHTDRGIALGALGRRSEALREADFISRTDTYRKDRYLDGWLMQDRAQVLVQAGATDAALAEIEKALARPSGLTIYELQHNVTYAPIRGDPRFQALLRKYAVTDRGSGGRVG
jgi:DNA-binding SARP family transcriptional activator/TolB-like protein/Tfp pilus assembly protein PilF